MHGKTIVERALELARTGDYPRLGELERQLRAEGYSAVLAHLDSPSLRRQLRELGNAARGEPPPARRGRQRATAPSGG